MEDIKAGLPYIKWFYILHLIANNCVGTTHWYSETDYSHFHLNITHSLKHIKSLRKHSSLITIFKKSFCAFYWKVFQEFLPIFYYQWSFKFSFNWKARNVRPIKIISVFPFTLRWRHCLLYKVLQNICVAEQLYQCNNAVLLIGYSLLAAHLINR